MIYLSFRRPIVYPILDFLNNQDNGRKHRMKCSPEEQSSWKIPFLMSMLHLLKSCCFVWIQGYDIEG